MYFAVVNRVCTTFKTLVIVIIFYLVIYDELNLSCIYSRCPCVVLFKLLQLLLLISLQTRISYSKQSIAK
jgi:hypothetical protein